MKQNLPSGKFKVIYADPAWKYDNIRTGGSFSSGSSQKYPTLDIEEIKSLEVNEISENDSILFLWSTVPFLPDALDVMKAWGFKYKTMITWKKTMRLGLGYWLRGQTEHLLIGIKGKVKPFRSQKPNFIESKVLSHSEKPEEFRKLIEELTSKIQGRKIELFARKRVNGWKAWGNELNHVNESVKN